MFSSSKEKKGDEKDKEYVKYPDYGEYFMMFTYIESPNCNPYTYIILNCQLNLTKAGQGKLNRRIQ